MKIKKFILPLLLLCVTLFTMVGCTDDKMLEKPQDTSLEFWVMQDVSDIDFSGHYKLHGFGADFYYGKGYQPTEIIEDSEVIAPEHCVIYTVSPYPDYSSGGQYVTRIAITDPQVTVYGITCGSTLQDFDATFENLGCTIQDKGLIHIATYGKVKIALASYDENKELTVWVEVTNKQGIDF